MKSTHMSQDMFETYVNNIVTNAKQGSMVMGLDEYDWVYDDHYPYMWKKISKRGTHWSDQVGKGITPMRMLKKILVAANYGEIVLSTQNGVIYIEGGCKPNVYYENGDKTITF